jgi:hypothetical protein
MSGFKKGDEIVDAQLLVGGNELCPRNEYSIPLIRLPTRDRMTTATDARWLRITDYISGVSKHPSPLIAAHMCFYPKKRVDYQRLQGSYRLGHLQGEATSRPACQQYKPYIGG